MNKEEIMKNVIRKSTVLAALSLLALVILGCPYSSTVYLTEPEIEPVPGWYGTWILDSTDEFPAYYEISEIDGTMFTMEKYTYDTEIEEYALESSYEAWFTDIGSIRFINIEDVTSPGTYYFYKLEMEGTDKFTLFEVTDNIDEVFTDSQTMYSFFEKYKELSFFYNQGEEIYLKAMQ
jgi:hypothetical protein